MISQGVHSELAQLVANRSRSTVGPPWLQKLQGEARIEFQRRGLPTPKDEAFRYTKLTELPKQAVNLVRPAGADSLDRAALTALTLPKLNAHRLLIVDGELVDELSDPIVPRGVSISQAGPTMDLERYLPTKDTNGLELMRTAMLEQVVTIGIAQETVVDSPIHVVAVSSGRTQSALSHPRVFLQMGSGSRATLIQSYVTLTDEPGLCNAGTNIEMGNNARLDHITLLRGAPRTSTVASVSVGQSGGSDYRAHSWVTGSALARNETHIRLTQPQAQASVNGLAVARDDEQTDNYIVVEHAAPHTQSLQRMAAIVDGRASASFGGNVVVRPQAQKTDARQQSQSLLLSNHATANTQPNLEIYADDVKCSHGATVGQLDEEALFYLRSRGLSRQEAERTLTRGFAGQWLQAIDDPNLRAVLGELLDAWLAQP